MKKKLSDYVWEYVAEQGTKHVFLFPGGGAMHLLDSVGKNEDISDITLLHEQACAMAAETYSRIAYQMGTILVTTGPGGTNAITGVAAAWMESTPMLVISGQVKKSDLKDKVGVRQLGNQEIGIVDIVRSITKYAVRIDDPQTVKYHLQRAYHEAQTGRPGPVWLDIPLDVQAAMIDPDELPGFDGSDDNSGCDPVQIQQIAQLLTEAKRPVIIAGQGIERRNGRKYFMELVELLCVPVITSWIATELIPHDHPYNLGKPGMVAPRYSNYTMQEADLIISIGTRLDTAMIGYNPEDFAPKAKRVIVDIDVCELEKFKFPIEHKVVCDAASFIRALTTAICESGYEGKTKAAWLQECLERKKKYPIIPGEYWEQSDAVNPYCFVDVLSDHLADDDVIIPGSSGATIDVFWMCIKNREKQRLLATGALGSMGYGLPAAIGACLASGKKRTICVEGEGSIQLNIQELADVKGMDLPIKFFIFDNGGYLSIMNMQRNHFGAHFVGANAESGLNIADINKIAQAYGLATFEATNHENMEDAIHKTLDAPGPALCKIVLRDDFTIAPRVMSRVSKSGSMISGSLSHMWPFLEEM